MEDKNLILFGNIYGNQFGTGYAGNVWDKNGLCPTLTCTGEGGGRTPAIIIEYDGRPEIQRESNR